MFFDLVLPEIFCQESTEHSKKQHQELPEIVGPTFAKPPVAIGVGMSMVVDFHIRRGGFGLLKVGNTTIHSI
jgi:hypothetical protein